MLPLAQCVVVGKEPFTVRGTEKHDISFVRAALGVPGPEHNLVDHTRGVTPHDDDTRDILQLPVVALTKQRLHLH